MPVWAIALIGIAAFLLIVFLLGGKDIGENLGFIGLGALLGAGATFVFIK